MAGLDPKQNIVVHHVLLRWMVAKGFRVTKTHRAKQFDQKPYMTTFIDNVVRKHSEAKTKVEKETCKLILNSAFFKMCESVRNRSVCDVVTNPEEFDRTIADPNFTSLTIVDSNMVLLHRKKEMSF